MRSFEDSEPQLSDDYYGEVQYDSERTERYGVWQCSECHATSYDHCLMYPVHEENCPYKWFQNCVYLFGDQEIERMTIGYQSSGLFCFVGWAELKVLRYTGIQISTEMLELYKRANLRFLDEKWVYCRAEFFQKYAGIQDIMKDCIVEGGLLPHELALKKNPSGVLIKFILSGDFKKAVGWNRSIETSAQ